MTTDVPITGFKAFVAKWKMYISIIVTVLGLAGGIFAFDDRYVKTKAHDIDEKETMNRLLVDIRKEVALNRSVMVNLMKRLAFEIEFDITQTDDINRTLFLKEKLRQLNEYISDLEQ